MCSVREHFARLRDGIHEARYTLDGSHLDSTLATLGMATDSRGDVVLVFASSMRGSVHGEQGR